MESKKAEEKDKQGMKKMRVRYKEREEEKKKILKGKT